MLEESIAKVWYVSALLDIHILLKGDINTSTNTRQTYVAYSQKATTNTTIDAIPNIGSNPGPISVLPVQVLVYNLYQMQLDNIPHIGDRFVPYINPN